MVTVSGSLVPITSAKHSTAVGSPAPATFAREHRREVDVEVDETAVLLVGVEAVAVLRSEQDHLLSATASMPLHGVPTPLIIDKIDRASCILSCIVFFQI